MPRARRSTRLPSGRTKYTNDPFELAGVSDSDSNGDKAQKGKQPASDNESSDEEFKDADDEDQVVEEEDDDDDENFEEEIASGNGNEDDENDDEEIASEVAGPKGRKSVAATPRFQRRRNVDGTIALAEDETHSRGAYSSLEHMGKAVHLRTTFGTDEKDLLSVIYARERWYKGADSGFPTRASLNEAEDTQDYGYGLTFGVEPEEVKRERTRGWDWYYDENVGGRFRKRQRLKKLAEKYAYRVFIPQAKEKKHTVLMGPVDDQKMFTLGHHESINFGNAFGEANAREKKGKASTQEGSAGWTRKKREGWVLNLGQKIQCMGWAPNQPSLNQYLAVAVPISKEQKGKYPDPFKDQGAPAFRPSAPYPCALQLWMFKAEREDSLTKHIDMNFKPKLRMALCANWGDLRRMAWCPMRRDPREEDEEDALKSVGLLAGVWGDGYVRVLDVKLSRDPNKVEFCKSMHIDAIDLNSSPC
jgi:transcription factor C subunit 6